MITKSIRWRLLAWLTGLLVVLLAGFGWTAYRLIGRDREQQIDDGLARRVAALVAERRGRSGPRELPGGPGAREVRRTPPAGQPKGPPGPVVTGERREPPPLPPDGFRPMGPRHELADADGPGGLGPGGPRKFAPSAATLAMFDETSPEAPYYGFWAPEGDTARSTLAPKDLPTPPVSEADSRTHFRTRAGVREAYYFTERGDCLLAGLSLAVNAAEQRRFAWWLGLVGAGVFVVGVGGGWVLVSGALRPVEKISATASRIAAGQLAERIDVAETESELGRLALVLNTTFARLEAAFAEQRQFTADASHEMRTPLAVIISEAQMTLARERSAAEYRETVEVCLEAAQQMRRLAESLLQLARFDAGQETMRQEAVDLADIAGSTAALLEPLARPRQITLELETGPAPVLGDGDRLQQVVRNLIDNAIFYNVDGGRVTVRTGLDDATGWLTVADTGRGIAREDLPRVFERFYRADKARSRSGSRSGLGLAICRAIVEAHGGEIAVTSELGQGTTFTVSLPRRMMR